jgi:ATP-binding cassette subfamily B protein
VNDVNQSGSTNEGRFADLRFILRGNKRGLAVLAFLALVTAFCEAFFLGVLVQSVSALSGGRSDLVVHLGLWSFSASVQFVLALAVLAALVRGGLASVVALMGPRIAAASRERHRRRLFSAYLSADWTTQAADKHGYLLQTLSSAVNDANTIVALTTQALPALLTLIVLLAVALVLSPLVTGSVVMVGVAVGLVLRPISNRAHRASRADAAGRNATASLVAGVLAAGAEISVLGSGRGVLDAGLQRIATAEHAYARAQGLKRLVSTTGQSVAFLLAASGLWVLSTTQWTTDFATIGTITVLLLRGAGLAQQVQIASSQYGAVLPFIAQVRTQIAHYEGRHRTFGTHEFPASFDITLEDIEYTYPSASRSAVRVERASFMQGSSTAIVGPSGSGKSTLMQLILRLREPSRGRVRIGGVPADLISEEEFSARVAYVPQTPTLVPGTIYENIRFFRSHLTREDVVRAAELAHIHDDVRTMSDGYDTVLDAHVDMLSGGQKQRLALARAMASSPAIIFLDEPTSALDSATEAAVVDTLAQLHGETTVILVTHKMSSAAHCDSVLALKGGRLVKSRHVG